MKIEIDKQLHGAMATDFEGQCCWLTLYFQHIQLDLYMGLEELKLLKKATTEALEKLE